MIEKHIPTKEEIEKFLQKIEQRITSNNNKPWKPQQHQTRLLQKTL